MFGLQPARDSGEGMKRPSGSGVNMGSIVHLGRVGHGGASCAAGVRGAGRAGEVGAYNPARSRSGPPAVCPRRTDGVWGEPPVCPGGSIDQRR